MINSYDRLAGFFMTLCNIIDQLTFRNEVAVFQNVLEIQSDKFHYNPTLVSELNKTQFQNFCIILKICTKIVSQKTLKIFFKRLLI